RDSPSNFPKYPAYKDSGVEWLGDVPESWTVTLLKRGYEVVLGKMLQPEAKRDDDEFLPYLRAANIQVSGVDISDVKKMWFGVDEKKSLLLRQGDLLVSEGGDVGRSAIWDLDEECYFQNSINRIRSISGNDTRFLYFWMITIKGNGYVDVLCNKSTIAHFTAEKVAAVPLPIPSIHEQTQIARFLDHETARIDALIEEQQRLIELLKEKRQAVISHAVTKGLDPTVPMKDSGVEWLGEVPAHWQVKRLKHLVPSITVGIVVEPSKYYVDDGVPALRSLNVKPGAVVTENLVYLSEESNELHAKSKIFEGDIVAVRSGQPGTAAIVPKEFNGANCIDLIVIRKPLQGCSTFIFWYLNSDAALKQFSEGSSGAIQQHFNIAAASEMIFAWPPANEQLEINSHLDRACHQLDRLISVAGESKSLLLERRSALISAAVTGKIDVRGWQPPASTQAPEPAVAEAV
ncbi:TPA: restriction endonuclease subunit S, partial [Pseudomonas aeruginosa]